jgi:DNA polymerase III epsilon subunit-like protein
MNPRFILGDTETTDAGKTAKVCEIAWVEVDEDLNIIDSQHSLIDPQARISATASGIHGITNIDVADAPTMAEFFEHIYGRRLTGDVVFMAHNVKFDLRFFEPFVDNLVGTLCTLRLARRLLTEAENHKLPTLMYQYGLERGESHSADGDVRTTLDLLRLLKQKAGLPLISLADLSTTPLQVERWPFGKHKDKPLAFDKGYVSWALKNMTEIDEDLRWSLEQVAAGKV